MVEYHPVVRKDPVAAHPGGWDPKAYWIKETIPRKKMLGWVYSHKSSNTGKTINTSVFTYTHRWLSCEEKQRSKLSQESGEVVTSGGRKRRTCTSSVPVMFCTCMSILVRLFKFTMRNHASLLTWKYWSQCNCYRDWDAPGDEVWRHVGKAPLCNIKSLILCCFWFYVFLIWNILGYEWYSEYTTSQINNKEL